MRHWYLPVPRSIVGRKGALIGLVSVGLWLYLPAWYVNWSRTTSLAANSIIFIAVILTWEAVGSFIRGERRGKLHSASLIVISSLMNAGVFLFHFRVAGYFLPLLLIICIVQLWMGKRNHQLTRGLGGIVLIGILSIILILPALIRALATYFDMTSTAYVVDTNFESDLEPLKAIYLIGAQKWVFLVTGVVTIAGLLLRNKTIPIVLTWLLLMGLEVYAYLTDISVLMFTNVMGVAAIMYLPLVILLGLGCGELINYLEQKGQVKVSNALFAVVLIGSIGFIPPRITGIDDYRYLFTADDLSGMEWITNNTPNDAVIAINSEFWLESSVIGTDGGYWIPYFTGRKTTAGNMLSAFGSDYPQIISRSKAAIALYSNNPSVESLCELGVDYLYNGAKSPYTGEWFDVSTLSALDQVQLSFQSGDVIVLKICDR